MTCDNLLSACQCRLPLEGRRGCEGGERKDRKDLGQILDSEMNEGIIVKSRCRAQPDSYFGLLPH